MSIKLETENGYSFFEVCSALQKAIRRGEMEPAMFWAFELDSKFGGALWTRLVIISHEDVGLASPETAVFVETARQHYLLLKDKPDRRMILTNAVAALVRAPKTRLADDLCTVINRRRRLEGWRLQIPDEALDQHTRRGKSKGRGMDHFIEIGAKLNNEVKELNRWGAEANRLRKKFGANAGGGVGPFNKKTPDDEGMLF